MISFIKLAVRRDFYVSQKFPLEIQYKEEELVLAIFSFHLRETKDTSTSRCNGPMPLNQSYSRSKNKKGENERAEAEDCKEVVGGAFIGEVRIGHSHILKTKKQAA
jgi:hypothetical protein